jgi:4-amino-4-deoxy-L-arabinose transferase-like glycosyltransferase
MKIKKILRDYPMLIIILLLGSYIRLYNIDNLGIYDWDSAYYGNTAKVPILTATWLFNNSNNGFDNEALKDYLLERGCNSHIVKPGHLFLITISYLIFGINDLAVLMVSALSGIGIILLTFFIANRM